MAGLVLQEAEEDPMGQARRRVLAATATIMVLSPTTRPVVTGIGGGYPLVIATTSRLVRAAQSPTGQSDKTAGEAFKNIQVFTTLPESQLNDTMFFMKSSLGVSCTHCHVDFDNFEKDDKPAKHVARDMIRMVRALNGTNFGGRNVITCNTCHRGQVRPSAPLSFAPIVGSRPTPKPPENVPNPALPTVDQIFDRYVEATGGRVAQAQVATLVMRGSLSSSEGWTAPLELDQKAPAKSLSTFQLQGTWRSGFNGTAGWQQDNQDVHTVAGTDLALFRLQSSFFRPSTVKGLYSGLALVGTETVAGHAAYVVEGTLTGAGPQRLFFDIQSGLLVRVTAWTATAFGPLPEEFDLENYRDVGNVKVPFTVSNLKPDFSEVDRLETGEVNVPIDDARFERPGGKR
jgi:photosynthetic reaction center cytochrome c subunit